ncbi:TrlF family AAA-like ATPase [Paracoccus sp. S1E-3]|uniref:TrlF family AAA-like ATPase n=1 Tax=uncultured Paracoccus sp. TaxID=189685 RepID=UPI001C68A45E|nr:hypothetical protein [Paracoccus sp. S1E-3]
MTVDVKMNRGSEWRRWEPHIHAPGTTMNDQFTGPTAWEDYLGALEKATPTIEAIAVTDYYVTDTYEEVLRHKAAGRLPDVKLIFLNVELRLDVATARGGFVNLHLFVSPEDPGHVEELQRLLSRLQFNVMQDRFDCTRADLIRLGKAADPKITDDGAALAYGANQFKVNFQKLREVFSESAWAKKNILIAVAGGANDGTSGVREAADQTIRREIETFAHVIFASSAAQREFWLGQRQLSPAEIRSHYGGLKPCLHGSDAHKLEDVASPFGNRFSWIKGALEFDALRQACIDPQGRAHVGAEPPAAATPSQVISQVEILNAEWAETPIIPLNPGLVAIIGARGSGKTALADMIAAGCDSITEEAWNANEWANPSFLVRARPLLSNSKVKVSWAAGEPVERSLDGFDANGPFAYERVRYLSQQFVEELCSSSGLTDGLLREIERVIFEAHPDHERDGALDFDELLDHRATRHRLAREREADAVTQISDRISTELEKEKMAATYESQAAQKKKLVDAYTTDRAKLVSAGSEKRAERHTELASAANTLRATLRRYTAQRQTFLALQDEVKDQRRNQAPETLRQAQARHSNSGMSEEQWAAFLLDYKGSVDENLASYVNWADGKIAELKGVPPAPGDPNMPYFPDDTDLSKLCQAVLDAEMSRLEKLVSADKDIQRRYTPAAGLFSAAEVSAPHERLRIFILAHTDEPAPRHRPLQPGREQRIRCRGPSVHPEGRGAGAGHCEGPAQPLADPGGPELEGQFGGQHHPHRRQVPNGPAALSGGTGLHPPCPTDLAGWATVLAARPDLAPTLGFDDCLAWARRLAADPEGPIAEAAEPALRRMVDGLAHRARALRLLGNGVHPLAASHAWRTLAAAHGLGPVDLAADRCGPAPGADGFP